MKLVKEMPISGQFAVMWIFNGDVWSETWRWNDHDQIEILVESEDNITWRLNQELFDGGYKGLDLWFGVAE